NKLFTTILFVFCGAMCTHAQIQFTDHEGNAIPDGSEVRFTTPNAEILPYGMYQIPMEIDLRNVGNAPVECVVSFEVTYIDTDKGAFYCCAFGNCVPFNKIGVLTKGPVMIDAGSVDTTLRQTEWSPKSETAYGKVQFTMTVKSPFGDTSINVTLENAGPVSVNNNINNGNMAETARYNASGLRIYKPQRGINIVRYDNGTIQKIIIK
ncbi:MAG: hypothetical protein K2J86_09090, partial [Prevotella sp.]|nr:hypothetical protein [Prevotella sp.]